jgi:hypothetical protein
MLEVVNRDAALNQSDWNGLRIMTAIQDRRCHNGRHALTEAMTRILAMTRSMLEKNGLAGEASRGAGPAVVCWWVQIRIPRLCDRPQA